jgi:hypothetical protein
MSQEPLCPPKAAAWKEHPRRLENLLCRLLYLFEALGEELRISGHYPPPRRRQGTRGWASTAAKLCSTIGLAQE